MTKFSEFGVKSFWPKKPGNSEIAIPVHPSVMETKFWVLWINFVIIGRKIIILKVDGRFCEVLSI